jgi:hypothetical protein
VNSFKVKKIDKHGKLVLEFANTLDLPPYLMKKYSLIAPSKPGRLLSTVADIFKQTKA